MRLNPARLAREATQRNVAAAAETAALAISKARLSSIMDSQVYGSVIAQAQTATNFCYHMTIVIAADAKRFRIAIDNASTTLPFRIKYGIISTSDRVGADVSFGATLAQDRFTPQNGAAWTAITWNSGAANVEIPAVAQAGQKNRQWTDWIDAPTPDNIDGSGLRVMMCRFWVEGTTASPGNGYCTGQYTQQWRSLAANTALHGGFLWQCIRSTVDGVSAPANFQPNTDLSTLPFITAIQYEAYQPGLTINGVGGDSLLGGAVNASGGNFGNGWLWQYTKLMRAKYPNLPIEMSNNGMSGTLSTTFTQAALNYIAAGAQIGLPICHPFTQNDGTPNSTIVANQKSRLATIELALAAISAPKPVLMTPYPNSNLAWDATADAVRLGFRDELLALRQAGRSVIDSECVSNGATPARYLAKWTTDLAHTNEPGGGVVARAASSAIALPF